MNGWPRLIRAAMPPTETLYTQRDLWPDLASRLRERRRVAVADRVLVGVVLAAGPLFPEALLFLMHSS